MHGVPERVLLRHLLAEAGGSRVDAARQAGVGKSTMYRWIEDGLLDEPLDAIRARYTTRPPKSSKLTSYHPLIQARLTEFPKLRATRLFAECRAAGYAGGYSQLRDYVRTLRPAPEPVQRFETPPGLQAQVDWAECRLPWGKRSALIVVLGFSRYLWVRFYPRQDLATLEYGLAECFTAWGGVARELLFDQMKSVLTRDDRLAGGGLVTNLECQRFAAHYGFRIRVCRPYRAQTKGKVERPIRYLRESFLYGRTFVSDADLNAQVAQWLETVANPRVHGTTDEQPCARFVAERAVLLPLPARPYVSLVLTPRPALASAAPERVAVPRVDVERRSLQAYAALTALVGGDV